MDSLGIALEGYQKRNRLNNKQFAESLGFDAGFLGKIKAGQKEPGIKVVKALMRIPELRPAVIAYLCEQSLVSEPVKENPIKRLLSSFSIGPRGGKRPPAPAR